MNSVERVKWICKDRKIPISKLEKDLGYANGYISQLRKGVFPADRLSAIANYLSVSLEYLLTGTEPQKKPTPIEEDGLDEMEQLLMKHVRQLTPEQQKMLLAQMQVMKESQKKSSISSVRK